MKTATELSIEVRDIAPASFRDDVLRGLANHPKKLPCKYFYDDWGSRLFEEICRLPEYYVTRVELAIMERNIDQITDAIGSGCTLIEYGSGSSLKTRLLLDHARGLAAYIPIDISRSQLHRAAVTLARRYPELPIRPVCADYTQPYELPTPEAEAGHRIVYFPGSTIGNFQPHDAADFLRHVAGVCGPGGALLIGVDLKKDPSVLAAAYNDTRGVTAEFNLNLLRRVNRELGADFDPERFAHYAFYNPRAGRIEMHLVSLDKQVVHLGDTEIGFQQGESIWTENSYKYSLEDFRRLAESAGFSVERVWTDPDRLFSIHYLTVPVHLPSGMKQPGNSPEGRNNCHGH